MPKNKNGGVEKDQAARLKMLVKRLHNPAAIYIDSAKFCHAEACEAQNALSNVRRVQNHLDWCCHQIENAKDERDREESLMVIKNGLDVLARHLEFLDSQIVHLKDSLETQFDLPTDDESKKSEAV